MSSMCCVGSTSISSSRSVAKWSQTLAEPDFFDRRDLGRQTEALRLDLSLLQSSLSIAQDFAQLPTINIWHQQLRSVMQQALWQDLSLLSPSVQPLPSTSRAATRQASRPRAQPHSQIQLSTPLSTADSADVFSGQAMPASSSSRLPSQALPAASQQLPRKQTAGAAVELPGLPHVAALPDLAAQHQPADLPHEASDAILHQQALQQQQQHVTSGLPGPAGQGPGSFQAEQGRGSASQARLRPPSHQATARLLPTQAMPLQRSFLSDCLCELLRLTDPYVTQYQPLLCGWYDVDGEEIIGLG